MNRCLVGNLKKKISAYAKLVPCKTCAEKFQRQVKNEKSSMNFEVEIYV